MSSSGVQLVAIFATPTIMAPTDPSPLTPVVEGLDTLTMTIALLAIDLRIKGAATIGAVQPGVFFAEAVAQSSLMIAGAFAITDAILSLSVPV